MKKFTLEKMNFSKRIKISEMSEIDQNDEEISNNVQQLYLLQVHNYYKNRFYLQLVRIREWSLYPTLAVITGILIAALISFLILP